MGFKFHGTHYFFTFGFFMVLALYMLFDRTGAGLPALCCVALHECGHIAAMHLKETRPGVYREVPYGTGHVDFPGAVRRALDLGVRAFTAEFWYTGEPDWKARLLENNRFLRRQFERCGDC